MTSLENGSSETMGNMLAQRFPVNSIQEITLTSGESISGRVYCTDEMSGSIVLQKALVHTTLASEIRIISVDYITKSVELKEESNPGHVKPIPLNNALPKIQKKALEERERRAIRLAEESLRHINDKATPMGQAVFDRLLKACGEVAWKGDTSILVLNQIQVDEPYTAENCRIVRSNGGKNNGGGLVDGSLDRVKKIVTATAADLTNTTT